MSLRKVEVLEKLVPKSLHLKLFTALLDNLASEHAARVIAMQVATDNADDLLRELKLTYNKTRQQELLAELLISWAEACSKQPIFFQNKSIDVFIQSACFF